jgi:hypothetical protein
MSHLRIYYNIFGRSGQAIALQINKQSEKNGDEKRNQGENKYLDKKIDHIIPFQIFF